MKRCFPYVKRKLSDQQRLQIIREKDILTVEEAALYLNIHPGVLLEEVGLGYLPGGKLAGEWRFCRDALLNHFSIYKSSGPYLAQNHWVTDDEDHLRSCDRSTVEKLLYSYKNGERDFSDLNLRGADLSYADLSEADFYGSWLSRANFEGSILKNADLRNTQLREANLQGGDLSQADLREADLTEANLSHAVLTEVNLEGAILLAVDLTDTNLKNAKFR